MVETVPKMVCVAWLVRPPAELIVTVGATVSSVATNVADAALAEPKISAAVAVRSFCPSTRVTFAIFQAPLLSATAVPASVLPS